jgi:hypothetical protein
MKTKVTQYLRAKTTSSRGKRSKIDPKEAKRGL